jgi:hypothetical protein
MRVAEAAVVVASAGALARRTRALAASVWLVPAATALARMWCDPVGYGYYWATPLAILLVGAVQLVSLRAAIAARLRPA